MDWKCLKCGKVLRDRVSDLPPGLQYHGDPDVPDGCGGALVRANLRPVDIEPHEQLVKRQICEDTVAVLTGWLARAEAGEIGEVAIIGTEASDGSMTYALTGTMSSARRIGMLEILKRHAIDHAVESARDDES